MQRKITILRTAAIRSPSNGAAPAQNIVAVSSIFMFFFSHKTFVLQQLWNLFPIDFTWTIGKRLNEQTDKQQQQQPQGIVCRYGSDERMPVHRIDYPLSMR